MTEQLERLLGFDWGISKIGVAVGNAKRKTAMPLQIIPAKNGIPNWQWIQQYLINHWQPQAFVVGLPINMDGTQGALSKRAQEFANSLSKRFHLPHFLCDERLTTKEAQARIQAIGEQKKTPADALAACLIVEQWLGII